MLLDMSKSYYTNPKRRPGEGRGAPNKIPDADLLTLLRTMGQATVIQVAAFFNVSRSAAYYRLRAMLTEGTLRREPGPGRFDLWERADDNA